MKSELGVIIAICMSSCVLGPTQNSQRHDTPQTFALQVERDETLGAASFDSATYYKARLTAGTSYSKSDATRLDNGALDFFAVPNQVPYEVSVVGIGPFGVVYWFGTGTGTTKASNANAPVEVIPYVVKVRKPSLDSDLAGVWVKPTASSTSDTLIFDNAKFRTPYTSGIPPLLDASNGKIHCGSDMELCGEYRIVKSSMQDTLFFKGVRAIDSDSLVKDPVSTAYLRAPAEMLVPTITYLSLDRDTLAINGSWTGIQAAATSPKGAMQATIEIYQGGAYRTGDFALDYPQVTATTTSWDAASQGASGIIATNRATPGRYDLVLTIDNAFGRIKRSSSFVVAGVSTETNTIASTHSNGVIHSRASGNPSAFALLDRMSINSSSDSVAKDLMDATVGEGRFDGTLKAGNETDFIQAGPTFSFDRATIQSIADAFTGTPVTSFTAQVGDVWIARVKRMGPHIGFAIQFTEVHVESGNKNDGYVKFNYRGRW
ncbi:MAG TPA: hypothetical protein PK208_16335 [Fibrobacteria bacterium]|nr:hypothetical protein [Fibrobacteria bacterium]